jgi:outer membrane protein OmpA-like peptidoglycan-associated protein
MNILKIKHIIITSIVFFITSYISIYSQNTSKKLLGPEINLPNIDELNPQLSPDGKTLFFVRSNYKENVGGDKAGQDIYVAKKNDNGIWELAKNIGKPLNNIENNAIGSITKIGLKAYVSNVYGSFTPGISVSNLNDNKFSKPVEVFSEKEISSKGFLSFYVSKDEKYMLLSMYTDPIHNEDLFVSIHLEGGWTKPKTLGKIINTNGLEVSPFLSMDNNILFFSSNGRGGIGDADIFMSKRLDDSWTNWTSPVNLGPKVNTDGFDAYFVTDTLFSQAFFCSGENPKSSSDIYTINISDIEVLNKKMDTVILTTNVNKKIYGTIGKLLNKENYKYFSGATSSNTKSILEITEQADFIDYVPEQNFYGFDTMKVEVCKTKEKLLCDSILLIINVERQSMAVRNIITDATTGKPITATIVLNTDTLIKLRKQESKIPFEFTSELKAFKKNKITISQEGYFPQVFNFDLTDSLNSFVYDNNVALKPIEVGSLIGLKNIFFETGKSIIKVESYDELDNLANALLKNPNMKIFIEGHTDNKGNDNANLKLSEDRVKSVINFLVNKKVDRKRLNGKGYGSKKPIDNNETEEGRNRNRRVEFTIEKI